MLVALEQKLNLHQLIEKIGHKKVKEWLDSLSEHEAYLLDSDPYFSLREKQLMPDDDIRYFVYLILSGRGFGKTHCGASWVIKRACEGYGPISLVGQTAADVRDVMVEGNPSSIMELSPDYFKPHYEPSKRRLTWPNGVTATTFAGDEPDQLRGPQSATLWADELAKWAKAQESWDNAIMGLRISDNPRALITTTPRPIDIIKNLYKADTTYVVTGSTYENKSLSGQFLKAIEDKYEGTTLGRQELHGEIIWEDERALWKRALIDKYRSRLPEDPINYVIGVDPSTVGKKGNDETGISLCCGQVLNGEVHGYILQDRTIAGAPKVWAKEVKDLLEEYPTASIIAESNQGGEMVRETLLQAGIPRVKIQLVHHLKSKYDRAQPISLVSEQGFVHWCGTFEKLEDEMCSWTGDPKEKSPNRLDAVVIALTKILITKASKWQSDDMGV